MGPSARAEVLRVLYCSACLRRLPAGSRRRHALQCSPRNTSALADGPIIFKTCGAGKGWARKKSFFQLITANTQEGSCLRSTAGSLDRASWRPAGHLLSRSSVSDSRRSARREAQQQQSTRRSAISGGEHKQVRPSCRHLGIELQIASAFRTQISRPAALSKLASRHESKRSASLWSSSTRAADRTSSPTWKISPASGRCSSRAFIQSIKPVFFNILVCE